eukprot:gene12519-12653_t
MNGALAGLDPSVCQVLDALGVAHSGSGTQPVAAAPAVIERNGLRIAFLSYADHYEEYLWEVQPNDVMVAGTDGLFKNLMPDQIVKVGAQQRLSKYGTEKVPDGHVGVGGLRIEPHMELAARTATFWVKVEEAGLYGKHPGYTFWGKMSVLQKPATVIPVPLGNLLNLD